MRAIAIEILPGMQVPPIQLISKPMEPKYVSNKLATKKYKKVSKQAKARLLRCIEKGWSIVNVSKKFDINYSTAKSIVQNYKKRHLKGDFPNSSTQFSPSSEGEEVM